MLDVTIKIRYRHPEVMSSGTVRVDTVTWSPSRVVYPRAIGWDGKYIWIGTTASELSKAYLLAYDPSTKAIVKEQLCSGLATNVGFYDITFNGKTFYMIGTEASPAVHNIDQRTGQRLEIGTLSSKTASGGIAFDGRFLHRTYVDSFRVRVEKWDPIHTGTDPIKDFVLTNTTFVAGQRGGGIVHDGHHFWYHYDTNNLHSGSNVDQWLKFDYLGNEIRAPLSLEPGPSDVDILPHSIDFTGKHLIQLESPDG